jgi:predicted GNAT superfamily acetyltransferase
MGAQTVGAGVAIRLLDTPAEMAAIDILFQQVWGATQPVVQVDLLRAIAHVGGYVAGAYADDGPLIGASFGFLGRHAGELSLHSHVTGILPGVQHSGVGRAIKEHQRAWAASNEIAWITWTFDPLVRRNAWFNVEVLGAHVAEYVVDFYGQMHDAINGDAQSDRLVVAWPTGFGSARVPDPPSGERVEVATPDDIVALRRTDRTAAEGWRLRLRRELGEPLSAGAAVVGFTRGGKYVLAVPG